MTQWNPNCKGPCDCPGEEVRPEQLELFPSPMEAQLAQLNKVMNTTAEERAALLEAACAEHKLVQHRDRKPKWCDCCGRNANGVVIGGPRAFGRRVYV